MCVWGVPSRESPLYFPLKFPLLTPSHVPTMVLKESPCGRHRSLSLDGAAVGLSKSSALPCHRHGVFQVKDLKFGTKDGFQLQS